MRTLFVLYYLYTAGLLPGWTRPWLYAMSILLLLGCSKRPPYAIPGWCRFERGSFGAQPFSIFFFFFSKFYLILGYHNLLVGPPLGNIKPRTFFSFFLCWLLVGIIFLPCRLINTCPCRLNTIFPPLQSFKWLYIHRYKWFPYLLSRSCQACWKPSRRCSLFSTTWYSYFCQKSYHTHYNANCTFCILLLPNFTNTIIMHDSVGFCLRFYYPDCLKMLLIPCPQRHPKNMWKTPETSPAHGGRSSWFITIHNLFCLFICFM